MGNFAAPPNQALGVSSRHVGHLKLSKSHYLGKSGVDPFGEGFLLDIIMLICKRETERDVSAWALAALQGPLHPRLEVGTCVQLAQGRRAAPGQGSVPRVSGGGWGQDPPPYTLQTALAVEL